MASPRARALGPVTFLRPAIPAEAALIVLLPEVPCLKVIDHGDALYLAERDHALRDSGRQENPGQRRPGQGRQVEHVVATMKNKVLERHALQRCKVADFATS